MVAVRALIVAVAVFLEGCSRSPPPSPPVASDESSAGQMPDPTTGAEAKTSFADLVGLVKSGIDQKVLLAYIDAAPVPYQLATNELVFLADLGVSSEVLTKLGASVPETDQTEMTPPSVEVPTAPATAETPAIPVAEEVTAPPSPEGFPTTPEEVVEPPVVVAPEEEAVSISFFYEALAPYGNWMELDGVPCWQPTAATLDSGWRPYCQRGRWANTDAGWAWASDYSWGWAPFHYGRWRHHDRHGWVWAPDTVWAPAWVSWREHAGIIGWAPLPPEARYEPGEGFTFHGRRPAMDFEFGLQAWQYAFVRMEHFFGPGLAARILPGPQVMPMYASTMILQNNYTNNHNLIINRGPSLTQITAVTHREIPRVTIVDQVIPPGQPIRGNVVIGDHFEVYRPHVAPTAPETPRLVVARQQAETARREEARRSSVFDTVQSGPLVRNESVRGQDSRAAIPPASTHGYQPVVVRGQAEQAAEHLQAEQRQSQAAPRQPEQPVRPAPAVARRETVQVREAAAPQEAERLRAQQLAAERLREEQRQAQAASRQPEQPVRPAPAVARRETVQVREAAAPQEAERLRAQQLAAERLREEQRQAQAAQQQAAERLRQQETAARERAQQEAAAQREAERLRAQREESARVRAQQDAERLRMQAEAAENLRQQREAERLRQAEALARQQQQQAAEREREEQRRTQQAAERQREEQRQAREASERLRAEQESAARVRAQEAAERQRAQQEAAERQRQEQNRAQQEAAQRQLEEQHRAKQEAEARANAFQSDGNGSAAEAASQRGSSSHRSGH